jgi:hypothetical protein
MQLLHEKVLILPGVTFKKGSWSAALTIECLSVGLGQVVQGDLVESTDKVFLIIFYVEQCREQILGKTVGAVCGQGIHYFLVDFLTDENADLRVKDYRVAVENLGCAGNHLLRFGTGVTADISALVWEKADLTSKVVGAADNISLIYNAGSNRTVVEKGNGNQRRGVVFLANLAVIETVRNCVQVVFQDDFAAEALGKVSRDILPVEGSNLPGTVPLIIVEITADAEADDRNLRITCFQFLQKSFHFTVGFLYTGDFVFFYSLIHQIHDSIMIIRRAVIILAAHIEAADILKILIQLIIFGRAADGPAAGALLKEHLVFFIKLIQDAVAGGDAEACGLGNRLLGGAFHLAQYILD